MMKYSLVFFGILLFGCAGQKADITDKFIAGKESFNAQRYARAQKQLQSFLVQALEREGGLEAYRVEVHQGLHLLSHLFLRVKSGPEELKAYLAHLRELQRETDDDFNDTLDEWHQAAEHYKRTLQNPNLLNRPAVLLEKGRVSYRRGIGAQTYHTDPQGIPHLVVSESYLLPYVIRYDGHRGTEEALYLLGDIYSRIWRYQQWRSENLYFKELIRRFPRRPLARKAYRQMEQDMMVLYGVESMPATIRSMLDLYHELLTRPSG